MRTEWVQRPLARVVIGGLFTSTLLTLLLLPGLYEWIFENLMGSDIFEPKQMLVFGKL